MHLCGIWMLAAALQVGIFPDIERGISWGCGRTRENKRTLVPAQRGAPCVERGQCTSNFHPRPAFGRSNVVLRVILRHPRLRKGPHHQPVGYFHPGNKTPPISDLLLFRRTVGNSSNKQESASIGSPRVQRRSTNDPKHPSVLGWHDAAAACYSIPPATLFSLLAAQSRSVTFVRL